MKVSDLKDVLHIRPGAKLVYLDMGTTLSWVGNCSALLITNRDGKITRRYGEGVFLAEFTKSQVLIQKHVLKENQVVVIRGMNRDFIYQVNIKPDVIIGNPSVFQHPKDLSFFQSEAKSKENNAQG